PGLRPPWCVPAPPLPLRGRHEAVDVSAGPAPLTGTGPRPGPVDDPEINGGGAAAGPCAAPAAPAARGAGRSAVGRSERPPVYPAVSQGRAGRRAPPASAPLFPAVSTGHGASGTGTGEASRGLNAGGPHHGWAWHCGRAALPGSPSSGRPRVLAGRRRGRTGPRGRAGVGEPRREQ